MSTKIYNAFTLPKMSLAEMTDLQKRLREKALKIAERKKIDVLLTMAIETMDERAVYPKVAAAAKDSPIFYAVSKIDERQREVKKGYSDYVMDVGSFEVVFFPYQNRMLALVFAAQNEYVKLFEKETGAKDYSYWNNTDRPDNLSAAQWKRRGDAWDEVMAGGPPSVTGITLSILAGYDGSFFGVTANKPLVKKRLKRFSYEKRVEQWAKSLVISKHMRTNLKDEDASDMRPYFKARDYIRTPEGEAEVRKMKKEVNLTEILTIEILRQDPVKEKARG